MATEVKAPADYIFTDFRMTIFLGGSIEQGAAVNWQQKVVKFFKKYDDVLLLNPRRDVWDASWKQTKSNKNFREQVEWELYGQDTATAIIYYFDPATKSPITLLELGLYGPEENCYVVCPNGFWRKGNVDIVCEKYGIPAFTSLNKALVAIVEDFDL